MFISLNKTWAHAWNRYNDKSLMLDAQCSPIPIIFYVSDERKIGKNVCSSNKKSSPEMHNGTVCIFFFIFFFFPLVRIEANRVRKWAIQIQKTKMCWKKIRVFQLLKVWWHHVLQLTKLSICICICVSIIIPIVKMITCEIISYPDTFRISHLFRIPNNIRNTWPITLPCTCCVVEVSISVLRVFCALHIFRSGACLIFTRAFFISTRQTTKRKTTSVQYAHRSHFIIYLLHLRNVAIFCILFIIVVTMLNFCVFSNEKKKMKKDKEIQLE